MNCMHFNKPIQITKLFFSFFLLINSCLLSYSRRMIQSNTFNTCPQWMEVQIDEDLNPYRNKVLSRNELNEQFQDFHPDLSIAKFTLSKNKIFVERKFRLTENLKCRIEAFQNALGEICKQKSIPNVTFYIFLHDGLLPPEIYSSTVLKEFPLFVMSRGEINKETIRSILVPDYDSTLYLLAT